MSNPGLDDARLVDAGRIGRGARMRGRGWLVGLVVVAVVACAGGVAAGHFIVSPRDIAAKSDAPPATIITAPVMWQRIENAIVTRGSISAVNVVQVGQAGLIPPDSVDGGGGFYGEDGATGGSGVLTDVFMAVGDLVEPGTAVLEIDGRPVVVFQGAKATYRDMMPSMSGPDVGQLQESLRDLGFYEGVVTETFDAATKAAVEGFYKELGYVAPSTDDGDGGGGDAEAVQGARDALKDAQVALSEIRQARAEANATLAKELKVWKKAKAKYDAAKRKAKAAKEKAKKEKAKASASPSPTASATAPAQASGLVNGLRKAPLEVSTAEPTAAAEETSQSTSDAESPGPKPTYAGPKPTEVSQAEEAVRRARLSLDREVAHRGATAPRKEIVFVPQLPATVTQIGTQVGYAPSSPLFTLTPQALHLTSLVADAQAGLLKEGDEAEIELPDGPVTGTIASLTASTTPGQTEVEITPAAPLDFALGGSDVKVTFVAAATAGEVLAVPQGAISSDAAGQLSVIVQGDDDSLSQVPVTVGVSGNDLVEVTPVDPNALQAGDKVVIGG